MLVSALAILFCLVCLFMILVILIQKPKGGGLAGAFGGSGGSSQAVFGAKTGDVLTWFTVVCFTAFLLLAMGLTWSIKPDLEAEASAAGLLSPVSEGVGATDGDPASESSETIDETSPEDVDGQLFPDNPTGSLDIPSDEDFHGTWDPVEGAQDLPIQPSPLDDPPALDNPGGDPSGDQP